MSDDITGTGDLTNLVATAHNRELYFGLRAVPMHDAIADVRPAHQAMPGAVVTFHLATDMAAATSELTEEVDVDRVLIASTTATVTVKEYGNVVGITSKLRATGLVDVDEQVANVLAYNLVDSLDTLARDVLVAGSNVRYPNGKTARNTIVPQDTIKAADVRYVVAKMRGAKAAPKKNGYYVAYAHPDVTADMRGDTAAGQWRESHIYASPQGIYAGEIGAFEGAIFIETPRGKIFTDGGSSPATTDVYATIFCGQQALAKAVAIEPHLVQSPVVDRLRRLPSWGWYTLQNWGRFREAALYRLETASSIGTNS